MTLTLEGEVRVDDDCAELRQENDELRLRVRELERQVEKSRSDTARIESSAREIRRVLNPLYMSLRLLYGEIDSVVGQEQSSAMPMSHGGSNSNAKWESWKQKMPGRPAEMIDALLLHESMSTKQLMAQLHCAKQTVYDTASKLSRAGLLRNVGGIYSLNQV